MKRRQFLSRSAALMVIGCAATPAWGAPKRRLRVAVAASLLSAMRVVATDWAAAAPGRPRVVFDFGSSASLARRIELGAPADLFISANSLWMDHLESRNALVPATRRVLLSNRLALAAALGAAPRLASRAEIGPDIDLRGALGDRGRLAIARTSSAPLGVYGRQALTSLGLWPSISDRIVEASDARAALAFVTKGAAPLGVLYASDVSVAVSAGDGGALRLVGLFPEASHDAIRYPAALIKNGGEPQAAQDLLVHLSTPGAGEIFAAHGFGVPSSEAD